MAPTASQHVPNQYYGYSLQCTHCVSLLLDAVAGSYVSVEVMDDVAVEDPEGEVEAVQVKSALKTNPISNRSIELWKTNAELRAHSRCSSKGYSGLHHYHLELKWAEQSDSVLRLCRHATRTLNR